MVENICHSIIIKKGTCWWVLVSSISKISSNWIKNLEFNSHLHKKNDWCFDLTIIKSRQYMLKLSSNKKNRNILLWWVCVCVLFIYFFYKQFDRYRRGGIWTLNIFIKNTKRWNPPSRSTNPSSSIRAKKGHNFFHYLLKI